MVSNEVAICRIGNPKQASGIADLIFAAVRGAGNLPRACAKITSHYKRRCILSGGVAKLRNMLDIPALSRLASQAPQRLKSENEFSRKP
jgi:hypothetical protein